MLDCITSFLFYLDERLFTHIANDLNQLVTNLFRFLHRVSFGINTDKIKKAVVPLKKAGFLKTGDGTIRLTDKGMTVSNSIITEILENCDENT